MDYNLIEFEQKLKKQVPYQKSGYDEFLELKDNNRLFEEVDHKRRQDEAKIPVSTGNPQRRRLVQNDMVIYQLYSRYKEMIHELDTYKDTLLSNVYFENKRLTPLIENWDSKYLYFTF